MRFMQTACLSWSDRFSLGLGFRVWGFRGLGFRVWGFRGLGFSVQGLGWFPP